MSKRIRSLLFVPGDRPDRMEKALAGDADALILDLEDSVLPADKLRARCAVRAFVESRPEKPIFVRINPASSALGSADIAAVADLRPFGVVVPKCCGGAALLEVERLFQRCGNDSIRFLPIATETPQSVFALGSFVDVSPRLWGLTWGVEDISAAIGALSPRDEDGGLAAPYETLRALALFAAKAAGALAIDTIYPDLNDADGLARYAARGRRDGFDGMMALHPSQLAAINAAYTPSAEDIAWARRVVEAFRENPRCGVVRLDGKMLDAPHLRQAMDLLASRE